MSLHLFSGFERMKIQKLSSGPQQKKKRKKKKWNRFTTAWHNRSILQSDMVLPSGTAWNHPSVTTEQTLALELRGQLCLQPENSIFKYGMQKISTAFSVLHNSLHCTVKDIRYCIICYSILNHRQSSWKSQVSELQVTFFWCTLTCTGK